MTAAVHDLNEARSALNYALRYALLGWHVLPLDPGTKKPLGRLARNGFHDATTDEQQIRSWWTTAPDAGIGVALKASGLVAVDIDPRNGGLETMERLEAQHGPVVSDVLAFTGGGGEHRVFAAALVEHLPGQLGKGVDLKADGYIAVEPTIHPSGRVYQWEASSDPLDGVVPSTLPVWIRDMSRHVPAAVGTVVPLAPISAQRLHDVHEALQHVNADDRETWVSVGQAINNEMPGHEGFDLWDAWSQQSTKYNAQDQLRVWRSFKPRGLAGLGLNTVFKMAQDAGWKNAGPAVAVAAESLQSAVEIAPLDLGALAVTQAEPLKFLVDRWLPTKAVTVLTAHGGVGKSTMSIQLAVCLATGAPWFGVSTTRTRVLMVSCEDAKDAIHWRLSHVCAAQGVDIAALAGWLTIFDMTEHDCVLWSRGTATERMKWLEQVCAEHEPGCVILDNASDTFADNENDRTAVRGFVRALARVAIRMEGSVLLLAHVDKASARGTVESTDNYSGSTAWNNSARSRWAMVRNKDDSIQISNEKNNYAARQAPFTVEYDAVRHVFIASNEKEPDPSIELIRNQTRLQIMRALNSANTAGDKVSLARRAHNNALRVLKNYGFPHNIEDAEFWFCLNQVIQWKFVQEIHYKKANRMDGTHLVLTEVGQQRVATNSGAGPLWG